MNSRKIANLGVPRDCMGIAIQTVQSVAKYNRTVEKNNRIKIEDSIKYVLDSPEKMASDTHFGNLAKSIIEDRAFVRPESISYKTWGVANIEPGSHDQMNHACSLPMAIKAAMMPDAHVGYGLPIGGVLALKNAVVPYAVGVDIACRMKLSIFDIKPQDLKKGVFRESLENGTVFGVGQEQKAKVSHSVMDADWDVTRITRENKDKAFKQLGTSGSGNHFVEWGVIYLDVPDLGLESGEYVSLLSHSGSRGTGASVCSVYNSIARSKLPKKYEDLANLAWLDMDTQEGQEYWAAMNLMGEYAAANHDVIHKVIGSLIGDKPIAEIENHHNFAWLEEHDGENLYVHRKGATPAGAGVLGVIPGSMGTPAYVVRGKGNTDSLCSASHGAGRAMSRKKAKDKFNFNAVKNDLAKKGIEILSAGADEVPGVYKNIDEVMACQEDLVDKVARFEPRIVKMCGDGSKAED